MSRYSALDYRGQHDPDYPRILTDVDDDRPATDEEVVYCEHCEEPVLEGELKLHAGLRCCEYCRPHCPVCHDVEVTEAGQFCLLCSYWALGVEV